MEARFNPTPAVQLPLEVASAGPLRGCGCRKPSPALQPEFWATITELVHYGAAGLAGTIGHVLVMASLIQGIDMPAGWASTWGLLAGGVLNFRINYRWTFNSRKPLRVSVGRFLTVGAGALLANSLLMYGCSACMLPPIPSQAVSTALLFVLTFLLNKLWTF